VTDPETTLVIDNVNNKHMQVRLIGSRIGCYHGEMAAIYVRGCYHSKICLGPPKVILFTLMTSIKVNID